MDLKVPISPLCDVQFSLSVRNLVKYINYLKVFTSLGKRLERDL